MTYSEADLVYFLFADDSGFRMHVTADVSPNYNTELTQNALEENSDVTDNARLLPVTVTLTQFMSELAGQEEFEEYDPYFVGDHIKFHERVLLARQNKELISVDCGPEKGIFSDMMMPAYNPNWSNSGDGKSLNFTMTLQTLDFAATKNRDLAAERANKEAIASFKEKINSGQGPYKPAGGRIADATKSVRDHKTLTSNSFRQGGL